MHPPMPADIAALQQALAPVRRQGKSVGFVPTMGALHRGHTSLMDLARAANDFVVASIFVNPIQFGPHEDLERYPRPLDADLALCGQAGVDLVFTPAPAVMYPPHARTFVEVTELGDILCGPDRPGHFRGVCTVVLKFFNLVQPTRAYFGQKDAQQARIIQQMVRDLNVPVQVIVGPTVREADGLALSSRNVFLTPEQRREATVLFRTLQETREAVGRGERDAVALRRRMAERVNAAPPAVLDYAEIVDADALRPVDRINGPVLAALAVRFGTTRLIDNMLIVI